jgi:predicted metalloprotease with PDZ domain
MKRTLLFIALASAASGACAAEPAPTAHAAAAARAEARSEGAHADANAAEARAELAELRSQMQDLSRRMAELSIELGDAGPRAYAFRYLGEPDRALVGLVVSPDEDGMRINAVTPGSPAARAGLRDGDVITAIDGQPVKSGDAPATLAKAKSRLADLKEEQQIRIAYQRGKQRGEVTLRAERRKAWTWPALMNPDPDHPLLPEDFDERVRSDVERAQHDAERALRDRDRMRVEIDRARQQVAHVDMKEAHAEMEKARRAMRHAMPWWGLNLAPMNADLGRYFGSDKGALVISADEDSLPGLRAGDVITGIDGEPVARPEDVLRALRDQPAGKQVPIRVLRERKTLALALKAPEFKSIFTLPPAPPMPPEPPAAMSAPTPPAPPSPPTPPADL